MSPEHDDYGNVTSIDRVYSYYSESGVGMTAIILTEEELSNYPDNQVVQIHCNSTYYNFVQRKSNGSISWNIQSYWDEGDSTPIDEILGSGVKDYMEEICPGLYDEFSTVEADEFIRLGNGMAYYEDRSEEIRSYEIVLVEGNISLQEQNGIIDMVSFFFAEPAEFTGESDWVNENINVGGYDDGYGNGLGGGTINSSFDMDYFTLFGVPLSNWDFDSLVAYIESNYECWSSEEDGSAVYGGWNGEAIEFYIDYDMKAIDINASLCYMSIYKVDSSMQYLIDGYPAVEGSMNGCSLNDDMMSLFEMSLDDYLNSIEPGLAEMLGADGASYMFADGSTYISEVYDGCINIGNGNCSINIWEYDGYIYEIQFDKYR